MSENQEIGPEVYAGIRTPEDKQVDQQDVNEVTEDVDVDAEKHTEWLADLGKTEGPDAELIARIGCVMQALHISTSVLGDSEEAQEAKNVMYSQVMAHLSEKLGLPLEKQIAVHSLVVKITNELASKCGFQWTINASKVERPGDARTDDSPIVAVEAA